MDKRTCFDCGTDKHPQVTIDKGGKDFRCTKCHLKKVAERESAGGRMTFVSYIRKQKDRNDIVGDLARDAGEDEGLNRFKGGGREVLDYLYTKSPCDGAIEAVHLAWEEYQHIFVDSSKWQALGDPHEEGKQLHCTYNEDPFESYRCPNCGSSAHRADHTIATISTDIGGEFYAAVFCTACKWHGDVSFEQRKWRIRDPNLGPSLMERMKAKFDRSKQKGRSMIEFYKDGTNLAVATECTEPGDFLRAASKAIAELIESKKYDGQWQQQLDGWLPQIVEIACKLKGYKAEVQETRRLIAGPVVPQEKALVLRHDGYRAEVTNGAAKARS